jgi:hypothetical protein
MQAVGRIVLVIEAVHAARDELADGLRRLGLVAIPVADPASATVVLRSVRPDLVLWHGAAMDATGLAAVAGWRGRCPSARIVAVVPAAAAETDALQRGGADAVLPATVGRDHLEAFVLRMLGVEVCGPTRGDQAPDPR